MRLPAASVDAIVAGHSHKYMAHTFAGIPIIQSGSYGAAFGRVDITVEEDGSVSRRLFAPEPICGPESPKSPDCRDKYEGLPVQAEPSLMTLVAAAQERARTQKEKRVGATLKEPFVPV